MLYIADRLAFLITDWMYGNIINTHIGAAIV